MNDKEIEQQIHDIIEGEIQNNINEYLEENVFHICCQCLKKYKIRIRQLWHVSKRPRSMYERVKVFF